MIFQKRPVLIVGLDIGTSAVKIAVGEHLSDGGVSLIGSHWVESRGVRKGEVVNHADASACILQAIQETEEALNMDVREVELAVTGGHLESANHRGSVPIRSETHQVTEDDAEEAVENARACVHLSDGRVVLHTIRQQLYLDGNEVGLDADGLTGSRLEASAHCIYGIRTRFLNIENCLYSRQETSIAVKNRIFSGLASALAVLGRHEKEHGAIVLDMGAGITEYVVYARGMIRQTGVLAVGGDHFTNDLLIGFKLKTKRMAETMVREHGSVWLDGSARGKVVTMKTGGLADQERVFSLEDVHTILHCRMEETLRIIKSRIEEQGWHDLAGASVHLTGGCARIRGMMELAQSIFQLPVVMAVPQGIEGQMEHMTAPEMSTVIGLLKFGSMRRGESLASQGGLRAYVRRLLRIGNG